ncbi:MAG: hypothetical protein JWO72_3212 [Caulobacteraceae bacterium]|nr:hypothetical protein [Caulobacteraceae bacterium]
MDGRDGVVLQVGGEWEIRFERRLEHPAEQVWAAITGPGQMSRWFDRTQMPDPLAAGTVIRFHHEAAGMDSEGHITALDPPRLIEWLWSGPSGAANPIRWVIRPESGGCRLVMSQRVKDPAMLARSAAGWHACLGRMQDVLDGGHGGGMEAWPVLFERYCAELRASGVTTPQLGAPPTPPPKP